MGRTLQPLQIRRRTTRRPDPTRPRIRTMPAHGTTYPGVLGLIECGVTRPPQCRRSLPLNVGR